MNILEQICQDKRVHINHQKQHISEASLLSAIQSVSPSRGFHEALKAKAANQEIGLIAEIKKASPSKGVIREDFNPQMLAQQYQAGGATCLSVLTDEPYFQGKDEYLKQARTAVPLPVLRKDFMLDPYQMLEARALGADCILLIMAALEDIQAKELEQAAHELNMDVLVEVHNAEELDRALSYLNTSLLGINNRNLKTLEIDLATTETLAAKVPEHYTLVCESGIHTHKDIQRMQEHGIHCFLVGESLMKQEDVCLATKQLLGNIF